MSNKPALRFDHREIAVVFSLFVFVALLMFTVGILVGKGIAQAKFDAAAGAHGGATALPVHEPKLESIGAGDQEEVEEAHEVPPSAKHEAVHEDHELVQKAADVPPLLAAKPEKKEDELELIPLGPQKTDWNGMSLRNQPPNDDTKKLLKNPKIEALTEKSDAGPSRQTAAIGAGDRDELSFSNGSFTVQVGSYPNQKDAEERVRALKGLGFAHAYLSAKDLGDSNGTWFRVWLGYFPNYDAAKKSGDKLQARGEVKNYLVRKAELDNGTN